MAGDADTLGQGAKSVTDARDGVNRAWKQSGGFGSSPAAETFEQCCRVTRGR